jgi:hypothetical protein
MRAMLPGRGDRQDRDGACQVAGLKIGVDSPAFPRKAHLTPRSPIHLVARVCIDWGSLAHWRSALNGKENQ